MHKYRLVILNEDTFEERVSFRLNRLNVFILVGFSTIAIILLTFFLIAYTPLREYIPGYPSSKLRKQATQLMFETDSLKRSFDINRQYYASIRKVLTGDSLAVDFNKDSTIATNENQSFTIDVQPSRADSLLREKVAQEDRYNLFSPATAAVTNTLFPPVKGTITEAYDIDTKHYAVDVAVVNDEPVKAAADGTVIFSEWTADTGFVIILEHAGNLISVYKHNATLNKEQGDLVKAGEVIATVGSTGTLSTGPHLHFELWSGGYPVNPVNYINFE
ncbi:M23 family metallopeptidase [Flavimarina sp. Hel_I_48]|uniref:M23 family metallopeptidase n=1 Tax=Flavimarina sp. Hel_I_48 TaxID=1392488 RepID=UPI001F13A788|nr:M23 family metallopeptidase [Flavimarina sp. Hel_I_48]